MGRTEILILSCAPKARLEGCSSTTGLHLKERGPASPPPRPPEVQRLRRLPAFKLFFWNRAGIRCAGSLLIAVTSQQLGGHKFEAAAGSEIHTSFQREAKHDNFPLD